MTMQSPAHPPVTLSDRGRLQQSDRSRQIELFDGVTPTQMPAWRQLPEETRRAVTGLMARLLLEHGRIADRSGRRRP